MRKINLAFSYSDRTFNKPPNRIALKLTRLLIEDYSHKICDITTENYKRYLVKFKRLIKYYARFVDKQH